MEFFRLNLFFYFDCVTGIANEIDAGGSPVCYVYWLLLWLWLLLRLDRVRVYVII